MIEKIEIVKLEFLKHSQECAKNLNPSNLESLRLNFLGKKGKLTELSEMMKSIEKEQRPLIGKSLNELRLLIEGEIEKLKNSLNEIELSKSISGTTLDFSLPGKKSAALGSLHPVSLVRNKLSEIFKRMGFTIYEGPEVDLDFYNFGALNFADHHPARDMQDTFFLKNYPNTVLRTHTSNIEIHAMLEHGVPIRALAFGRTYRCDSDLTHTPMFHQMECLVVDEGISFAHLKGQIQSFLEELYGKGIKTRFRPSYFPFVEPGAEVDLQCAHCHGKGCRICKNTGWIEIGGCGLTHPNVFEAVGVNSEIYSGFAFGFGLDRMAMNMYQLPDLRQMFSGDADFLKMFPASFNF